MSLILVVILLNRSGFYFGIKKYIKVHATMFIYGGLFAQHGPKRQTKMLEIKYFARYFCQRAVQLICFNKVDQIM